MREILHIMYVLGACMKFVVNGFSNYIENFYIMRVK